MNGMGAEERALALQRKKEDRKARVDALKQQRKLKKGSCM
jgi:hypothetical protein